MAASHSPQPIRYLSLPNLVTRQKHTGTCELPYFPMFSNFKSHTLSLHQNEWNYTLITVSLWQRTSIENSQKTNNFGFVSARNPKRTALPYQANCCCWLQEIDHMRFQETSRDLSRLCLPRFDTGSISSFLFSWGYFRLCTIKYAKNQKIPSNLTEMIQEWVNLPISKT